MAKRPAKKYKPGELDEVRRKIGYVSPEEARRLSNILGGEIGVEKSAYDLQKDEYKKYASGKHKKTVDVIDTAAGSADRKFEKISKPVNALENELYEVPRKKGIPYFDRVKLDFLCARPEYGIKTFKGAIGTLFSFILPLPDNVNPAFLADLEKNILKPVTDLVKATRGLYTKTKEEIYNTISGNPLFARILRIFKTWDIETIELEIMHLKKRTRGQPMRNLLRLCKMIYQPIMLFSRMDEIKQILFAYKWAYNINLKSPATRTREKEKLISLYYDAEKNLPYVLNNIKKMLYPILLKRVASAFYHYEEFFITERENILNFLGIREQDVMNGDDIITSDDLLEEESVIQEESSADVEPEEKEADTSGMDSLPEPVLKGLSCLEKLYPKAGWMALDQFPDMYPYFKPLFNYPSGFELIPPTDPLHQLVILLSVLNELFYGFRHITWGNLRDKDMESYNIQQQVDGLINSWPLYIDEIIAKVYVSRLSDYCRQLEKDKSFKMSEVAKKIVTEMNWIKKNYLLPWHSLKLHTQIVGIIKRQVPRLSEITSGLKDLFSQVVAELKQKGEEGTKAKCESISNPWSSYLFDLENNTSRRLGKLLYSRSVDPEGNVKTFDRRNNANLLFYTVSIVIVLDYFINDKESHFYYAPSTKLFRSIDTGSDIPQYTVQTIDPEPPVLPDVENQVKEALPLKDIIEQKILTAKKNGSPFSVAYLNLIAGEQSRVWDKGMLAKFKTHLNNNTDVMIVLTDETLLLVLENRDLKNAVEFVKEVVRETGKEQLATGVLQYHLEWSYTYFLKVLDKIKLFTIRQGSSKLVCLDPANNKFRSIII